MDSRDGFVTLYARNIPAELKYLIKVYQSERRLASYSLAVRLLLESSPELAKVAAGLYNSNNQVSVSEEFSP